jgi:hypothetical protein
MEQMNLNASRAELYLAVMSLNDQVRALRELVQELRGDITAHITRPASRAHPKEVET